MKIANPSQQFIDIISSYFPKEYKKIRENIALCTYGILRSEVVNTAEIARHLHEINGLNFKANDMKVYRLLQSKNFQVSDRLWRGHIAYLFDLLKNSGLKKNDLIQINVDYTTDRDDFLILCASIQFREQSVPLYFSLRKYPRRAGMMDQKKMEVAFFKALRHLLPDSYQYMVVADRGFGNQRILEILENLQFEYVLRLTDNFNIAFEGEIILSSQLPHKNIDISECFVPTWQRCIRFFKHTQEHHHWILTCSPGVIRPERIYKNRFAIEKMFKNIKSGGFDLERLLVDKYDRFKRILFIACIAYVTLTFTGLFINQYSHSIKKNFSLRQFLLSLFSP